MNKLITVSCLIAVMSLIGCADPVVLDEKNPENDSPVGISGSSDGDSSDEDSSNSSTSSNDGGSSTDSSSCETTPVIVEVCRPISREVACSVYRCSKQAKDGCGGFYDCSHENGCCVPKPTSEICTNHECQYVSNGCGKLVYCGDVSKIPVCQCEFESCMKQCERYSCRTDCQEKCSINTTCCQ